MTLKNKYASAGEIPAELKSFYLEREGAWHLDSERNRALSLRSVGGGQLRDFNYVDDVVEALLLAAGSREADGMIYNLGSSEVVSLKQLAEIIASLCPGTTYTVKPFPPERKKIDIGSYYSDYSLAARELHWSPKESLQGGLAKTLAFFKLGLEYYV